ncbi:MAG TPA: hypothetical protein VF897_16605 [Roseiflexaceae bacterium]
MPSQVAQPTQASQPLDEPQPGIATQLDAAARLGHRFGAIGVGAAPPPVIQAKLTVGAADDRYEEEADRVAGQVMRMTDADVQRKLTPGAPDDRTEEEKDRPAGQVMRKRDPAGAFAAGTVAVQRQTDPNLYLRGENHVFGSQGEARMAALVRATQLGPGHSIVHDPTPSRGLPHYHIVDSIGQRVSGHFFYRTRRRRRQYKVTKRDRQRERARQQQALPAQPQPETAPQTETAPQPGTAEQRETVGEAHGEQLRQQHGISVSDVANALVIVGVSLTLLAAVVAALLDPEPATKLALIGLSAVTIGKLQKLLGMNPDEPDSPEA